MKPIPTFLVSTALALAACASGAGKSTSAELDPASTVGLKTLAELEKLFRTNDPTYAAERTRAIAKDPNAAPWLARAVIKQAWDDREAMRREGKIPEEWIPLHKNDTDRMFVRAANELVALGDAGLQRVREDLLRDRRAPNRQLAVMLLSFWPAEARIDVYRDELKHGTPASARTVLRALGNQPTPEARTILEAALLSKEWQIRGEAVKPLARCYKFADYEKGAERLWKVYREDDDVFVRKQALVAIGVLGSLEQARPLIEELERLSRTDRHEEAEAIGEALRLLTRHAYGTSVQKWRAWLGTK